MAVSTLCPQTETKRNKSRAKLLRLHLIETILDCKLMMNIVKHIEFYEPLPLGGCILEKSAGNAIFILLTHKAWFLLSGYVNPPEKLVGL
jgi:hypothetical protein